MTMNVTIFNIDVTGTQTPNDTNDNLVNAHIHNPLPPGGGTAPVVWGFFGSPFNDKAPNDFVLTPFTTGVGGTFVGTWNASEGNGTTLTAQLPNLLNGRAYINFHTVQFGGGEIRGQIVPEPASALVLPLAGAVLASARRRRRQ